MIVDLSTVADGQTLSADVCIVGGGPAGITLARKLAGRGQSVMLLEAGTYSIEPERQALYSGSMSGIETWQLDDHRFRVFGGGTNVWSGFCMPLRAADFQARDYIPESGWPITLDDLLPYYRAAQEDLELPEFLYDGEAIAALVGEDTLGAAGGPLLSRVFQFSSSNSGAVHRSELELATDVEVYLDANLVDIRLEAGFDRVERCVVRTLDGAVTVTVEAASFVLATGGLENARLLLSCNTQLEAGVANSSGLVGRYFMEHPHIYGSATLLSPAGLGTSFYEEFQVALDSVGGGTVMQRALGVLGLSDEVRASEGLVDLTIEVTERFIDEEDTGDLSLEDLAALMRTRLGGHTGYLLNIRAEQTPLLDSAATLTDDTDAFGMPRLDLRWQVRTDDLRAYARTYEILAAELGATSLGRLFRRTDDEGALVGAIRPGGHHMGTTRMHADATQGVVDSDCRTHDHSNLYLAGSSVFTTGGAANPTLTIVALANRLADHLAGSP